MSRPSQYRVFWRLTAGHSVSAEYVQVLVLTVTTSWLGRDVAPFNIRMGSVLYQAKLPAQPAGLGYLGYRALGLAFAACNSLLVFITATGQAGLLFYDEHM